MNTQTAFPQYFGLKGKKEERARLLKEAEGIQKKAEQEGRNFTTEEQNRFDKIHKAFNTLNVEIKKMEKQSPGVSASRKPTYWQDKDGKEIRVLAPDEKFSDATPDVSLGQCVKTMITGKGSPEVKNALSEGTDSAGGFTVPTHTLEEFFDKLRSKSRIVQAGARTIELSTDNTVIARVASDPTVIWHEENAEESSSDLTFEGAVFKPKTLMILVKASRELMSDSINGESILESVFAGTVGAGVDAGILFGSNANGQMKGLTSYGISEVDMGTNGAELENYDPLVSAYRKMLDNNSVAPTAYLMAPREWETLAVLKDSQNRYLDRPQALDDIPFLETTNIPTDEEHGSADNASRIVTGNWNDLVIGLRSEMRIELLRERYADSYQFGFLCHMRVDALPARNESFAQITGIIPESAS